MGNQWGTVAQWAGVIMTLVAVIVALMKDEIIKLWRRPLLILQIAVSPPDCHKTELITYNNKTGEILDRCACYYFRLWVKNEGNQRAEKVQVFVSKLFHIRADGLFAEDKSFLPMNLRWSHSQEKLEVFAEGISPEMGKHCDLGHMSDPNHTPEVINISSIPTSGSPFPLGSTTQTTAAPHAPVQTFTKSGTDRTGTGNPTLLQLDLEMIPNTNSHLIQPGIHRIEVKVAASNAKPITKIIEINQVGKWYPNEDEMFSNGMGLKEITLTAHLKSLAK